MGIIPKIIVKIIEIYASSSAILNVLWVFIPISIPIIQKGIKQANSNGLIFFIYTLHSITF